MSGKHWKTGASVTRTTNVLNPSPGDMLRQLSVLMVGGAVLIGFVVVSIGSFASPAAAESTAPVPVAAVSPTDLPPTVASTPTTLPPTSTATAAATAAATQTPTAAATVAAANTPTAAPSPTVTATAPAAAAPTATAAPAADVPTATAAPVTTGGAVSYSRDVQPIFNQICVKCHGGEETKEGLSLKSYAEVLAGSFNGTVVTPGDAANSLLIQQILNGKMPKQGPKLLPAQVRTLSDWVAAGAPNN